jgi:hypothetical protein
MRPSAKCFVDPIAISSGKILHRPKIEKVFKHSPVNDPVSSWSGLDLVVSAVRPFRGVSHYAGADHIQVHVDQASLQMIVRFYRGRMIAIFPICAFAIFPQIVLLRYPARDELHGSGNDVSLAIIMYKQMNMVGCDCIVQYA